MAAFTGTKLGRCLSRFGGSALTAKPNKLLLKNILKPSACMVRYLAFNSFPWIQSNSDIYPSDPLHHCILGSVEFAGQLKKAYDPETPPSPKELERSFKDCIMIVSNLISQMDPEHNLSGLLGSRLDRFMKEAFSVVVEHNFKLHLEVSDISDLGLVGIREVRGPLEPNSECYLFKFGNLQVFLSSDDEKEIKKAASSFIPDFFRAIRLGLEACERHPRIQLFLKFQAKETFFITGPDGEILSGSQNSVLSYHMWMFETTFPLSWKVADIDKYVHWRSPKYKSPFSLVTALSQR